MKYSDGNSILLGDKVRYNNQAGTIVLLDDVSVDSERFDPAKWAVIKGGLLIEFDNGALLHLDESDSLLRLSARAL